MRKLPVIVVKCRSCGASFETKQFKINSGRGKYCSKSCSTRAQHSIHSHTTKYSQSPTYTSWINMRGRCTNPLNHKYKKYGALGITVCDAWNDFSNFLADMGERPKNTSIDRINGSLGYFKENCKWSSIKEQQRNLITNKNITFNGKTQCISAWAEELNINHSTIAYRIRSGWPLEKALSPNLQYHRANS